MRWEDGLGGCSLKEGWGDDGWMKIMDGGLTLIRRIFMYQFLGNLFCVSVLLDRVCTLFLTRSRCKCASPTPKTLAKII